MRFHVKRSVIVCPKTRVELKHSILYGLLVSHGIRVDTTLYIVTDQGFIHVLDGYELRHLYPHDKSIEGFVKNIVEHIRPVPGYRVLPLSITNEVFNDVDLMILWSRDEDLRGSTMNRMPQLKPLYHIVLYCCEKHIIGLNKVLDKGTAMISDDDLVRCIVKAHYLIDILVGGWVRRRGRIVYYEPL